MTLNVKRRMGAECDIDPWFFNDSIFTTCMSFNGFSDIRHRGFIAIHVTVNMSAIVYTDVSLAILGCGLDVWITQRISNSVPR